MTMESGQASSGFLFHGHNGSKKHRHEMFWSGVSLAVNLVHNLPQSD